MPSPLPVKPICSSVLALTLTAPTGSASTSAIRARIEAMCGASFGAWQTTVLSMFPIS